MITIRQPQDLLPGFDLLADIFEFGFRALNGNTQRVAERRTKAAQAIADLRSMLDVLEASEPEFVLDPVTILVTPHDWVYQAPTSYSTPRMNEFRKAVERYNEDQFLARFARVVKAGAKVGDVTKERTDNSFSLDRAFGEHGLTGYVYGDGACTQVPTGDYVEKTVVEIPDDVKAKYTRTEKVAVTKWICPPLLAPVDVDLDDLEEEEAS